MAHMKLLSLQGSRNPGEGMMKYVIVSGGTLSGIGKGVVASSTGMILRTLGFNVTSIKIDPYLNVDAGTMSPFEHGEVFVLNDGGEADLDLGNYERFIGITLSRDNNITTGKIYHQVIEKERRGDYLGKTVQVVPHIIDAINEWIEKVARTPTGLDPNARPEVCVIELGGTVGDIESSPFIEALRQLQYRVGAENVMNMHVALVPVMGVVGEQKTKPIQQSVRELRACGLFPDIVVCRSSDPLQDEPRQKIAYFAQIPAQNVLSCADVSNLYHVPLNLIDQKLDYLLLHRLGLLPKCIPQWGSWQSLAASVDDLAASSQPKLRLAIVGKYTGLQDSYLSLIKAVNHAAIAEKVPMVIEWIEASDLEESSDAEDVESKRGVARPIVTDAMIKTDYSEDAGKTAFEKAWDTLKRADAILVPGGFGDRGIEGKVKAIEFARLNDIPFLGICLGMQMAVIEYCRHILGIKNANSEEFSKECEKVVVFMPEISTTHMGGTMRLGRRTTYFVPEHRKESKVVGLYKESVAGASQFGIHIGVEKRSGEVTSVDERHRHRYEVNPAYVEQLEKAGLLFVGVDDTKQRMEVIELPTHPYFVGVQYHPEFQSRPQWPSPPFVGLLRAGMAIKLKGSKKVESHIKDPQVSPAFSPTLISSSSSSNQKDVVVELPKETEQSII